MGVSLQLTMQIVKILKFLFLLVHLPFSLVHAHGFEFFNV